MQDKEEAVRDGQFIGIDAHVRLTSGVMIFWLFTKEA